MVAGIRNTVPLQDLATLDPTSYSRATTGTCATSSSPSSAASCGCLLWMLQTRVGKRTAGAAFRIAAQLVTEGMISLDEALRRVSGAQLAQLMFPRFDLGAGPVPLTRGWGFSRDDVEGAFFWRYLELGIFGISPFESIDRDGVGRLIRIAAEEGRAVRPGLKLGVCGEHGGDPESVHFFHEVGPDYVSCSPFRVPVARLEAGRAAITADGSDSR